MSIELRPVHELALGRWRVNWRVGRYRWFMFDRSPRTICVVTPFAYLCVGVMEKTEDE